MKTLILIVALVILSYVSAFAQGCLPQGITFGDQGQINNFQTNYPGCTEILGDVDIHEQIWPQNITNLQGLNVITSIGGDLTIQWDGLLTNLSGLDNLTSIGGQLYIHNCSALTSLTGLESLDSIGGRLKIENCYYITNLSGLESLTTIGNSLEIVNATDLTDISGLGNLVSIGTHLILSNNNGLISLIGLEGLTSINGGLEILGTTQLNSLTGLTNLTSVGGYFSILNNHGLTNLSGIENLLSIGGRLWIMENDSLNNLTGIEGLTSIGGDLKISYNNSLTYLIGIENIQPNSIEDLTITDNPLLHLCEVNSICEYLAAPGGEIDISDNAPGCNSAEEVSAACVIGVEESKTPAGLSVIPNPASSFITITTPQGEPVEEVIIYNHLGQKVLTAKPVNNTVDVSGLNVGMYFLEIITKGSRWRTRLVVE
jgi:hypothetical protein